MSPTQSVSLAALAAGLPRYVYWHGRSGRRYLFTATDPHDAADFIDGVAILVRNGAIVWTGEVAGLADLPDPPSRCPPELYVHLLATTPDQQRAIVEDLRPAAGEHLRLAA